MRPNDAPQITQKSSWTTCSDSASSVRKGPAKMRRLSAMRSAISHTTSQNTMMAAFLQKFLRPCLASAAARRSAAARSSASRRSASSSSMTPCACITRITCDAETPSDVSMENISCGCTPFDSAMPIMAPICASAMPFWRIICAICATRSSGSPIFCAMAAICIRGASSAAAALPLFPLFSSTRVFHRLRKTRLQVRLVQRAYRRQVVEVVARQCAADGVGVRRI